MGSSVSKTCNRPTLCPYCRSMITYETRFCPGCKLDASGKPNKTDNSSPTNGRVDSRERRLCEAIENLPFIRKNRSGTSPMCSLNMKPSPLQLPLSSRPKKRAVICGVSYKNANKYKFKGTINDVMNMKDMLTSVSGYEEKGILVLSEYEELEEHIPTRKNIKKALEWLVEGCQEGDSLVFYFSGHGLRQPDFSGDEIDGFDETICPVDFMEEGMILDNEINSTIIQPLPTGAKLHVIVDASNSGTILDLIFVYNRKTKLWEDDTSPSGVPKGTKGGLAISISACEDSQVASDASAFTGKMNGALTYIFIELVKEREELTYGDLVDSIQEAIDDVNKRQCFASTRFLNRVFGDKLSQKVQLSASEKFDVYKTKIRL